MNSGSTALYSILLCLFTYFLRSTCGMPLGDREDKFHPKKNVLDFMKRYGYLAPDTDTSAALYSEEGLHSVIKEIQRFGAIPQSGVLDNATLNLMSSPRCGVPDIRRNRSKRFVAVSKGWHKRNITYFIANWPATLGEYKTKKDIKLALTNWGKYGRLYFEEGRDNNADIIILFATGYHGDYFPFDGQGSILAHAYFPNEYAHLAGDAHFDADEHWTKEPSDDGIYFYAVAFHELGHSLGLQHSPVRSSIMYPYYKQTGSELNLDYDDIIGMYELYIRNGPPEIYAELPENSDNHRSTTERYDFDLTSKTSINSYTTPSSSTTEHIDHNDVTITYEGDWETVDDHKARYTTQRTPRNESSSPPDICQGGFDAVAMLRQELFIFKDEYIWRLKEMNEIEPNYPAPIKQMFPSLPDHIKRIDAAYERPDGMIVLFVGKEFWVYNGYQFVENSPLPLTYYGLPSELDKIDAVQIWDKNSKTYLYSGDEFWRYNETSKTMDPGYPMEMGRWRGVPSHLDAAVTWRDGITYFFKGREFWKFDNLWVIVTDTSPLPIPQIWLGCPKEVDLQ